MDLETELLRQINDSTLSCNERAWLRCELARKLEEAGNYDAAQEALGGFWQRIGERPNLEGLDQHTAAEVLLRVGVLFRWVGSTRQLKDAQEKAKDLISESISIFETLQNTEKVAEALTELGSCYWREGALDEARVVLTDALNRLRDKESELRAVTLLRSALVECASTRYNDALRIHNENAPLVEASGNHALKGKFHNELGAVLTLLADIEHREDYKDRAFVEYAAASFHFEQAGHRRYQACVENNLGFLFFTASKFTESHEHLTRARQLLLNLKDAARVAQVDETRARVFLAEGKNAEAERVAREAVRALETGGEQHILAEALTTHGTAQARTGDFQHARLTLERAILVAEQAGDLEGAGQAALTVIEELGEHFTPTDLSALYERAAECLRTTQHPGVLTRLSDCARRVLYVVAPYVGEPVAGIESGEKFIAPGGYNFSFWEEVERYEAFLIKRALKDAGGALSRASDLLSMSYQTLSSLLKGRHKKLFPLRTPPEPRRKSLLRHLHGSRNIAADRNRTVASFITILHVEDNQFVADAVKGRLETENWRVVSCSDGALAVEMLESDAPYSLLLFDYDLPHIDGIELVCRARALPHRRHTPIIMLSASKVEREAQGAGVDAFLMKPEGVNILVETIARLLNRNVA